MMKSALRLSGNILKIIAMFAMLIDHIGMYFFPKAYFLRVIGRLAFPIFAFMIAEGCRYTRNKLRYFLMILTLAIIVQLVYYFAKGSLFMSVLVSFSLAIPMVYALMHLKTLIYKKASINKILIGALALVLSIGLMVTVCLLVEVDYGILGCLLPAFASILYVPKDIDSKHKKWDIPILRVLCFAVCCIALAIVKGKVNIYLMLAIPILVLYSGKRGRWNIKYLFYLFYPLHLVLLEAISMLV